MLVAELCFKGGGEGVGAFTLCGYLSWPWYSLWLLCRLLFSLHASRKSYVSHMSWFVLVKPVGWWICRRCICCIWTGLCWSSSHHTNEMCRLILSRIKQFPTLSPYLLPNTVLVFPSSVSAQVVAGCQVQQSQGRCAERRVQEEKITGGKFCK